MLKERINQFWRELSGIFLANDEAPICAEITLPTGTLLLPNGQNVCLHLNDSAVISEMEAIEFEAYQKVRSWKASDFEYDMLQNLNSFYLQGFMDNQLVGFIGCRRDAADVHISNFVIDPDFQSLGIGSFLMNQLLAVIPQINRNQVSLEVRISNVAAQRFYERFGFEKGRIKRHYYIDNQEDAIVMTLIL